MLKKKGIVENETDVSVLLFCLADIESWLSSAPEVGHFRTLL